MLSGQQKASQEVKHGKLTCAVDSGVNRSRVGEVGQRDASGTSDCSELGSGDSPYYALASTTIVDNTSRSFPKPSTRATSRPL